MCIRDSAPPNPADRFGPRDPAGADQFSLRAPVAPIPAGPVVAVQRHPVPAAMAIMVARQPSPDALAARILADRAIIARPIIRAPAVRPISGRSPARPSAIPMAIAIGVGRSACSCRLSSSPAIIITTTIGAWAWARRPMAIAGCATAPTCCWSKSGRAAWSMSSMAPSTEAETGRAASSDAALFSCPDHSPRRVKRKTVAGGKLRTVWPARTTSRPS